MGKKVDDVFFPMTTGTLTGIKIKIKKVLRLQPKIGEIVQHNCANTVIATYKFIVILLTRNYLQVFICRFA